MSREQQVGKIVYEVEMNVSRLIESQRQLDSRLNRVESGLNNTSRATNNAERSLSSLSRVAGALMAILSVQQVAAYADAWTQLNNKVSNSVRAGEQQADVMQRIFDISQSTQSSLNGTATLYARLERGTRNYNTSAQDLTRLTTIINQGFAVSGATAQESENAIVQLSQGLAAGALRGEEFNSVSEQGSRLMIALADSLGVNLGQLRAMAAQGKLTTDVIVNGLLSQGDAIGKEFANTTVTISHGLLVAGNNLTKFFGENSTVKSFAAGFRDSVITISENLDGLSSALIAVAAVMGGRFVGALTMATSARIADTLAAINQSKATSAEAAAKAEAARITTIKLGLDREQALSNEAVALTEYNVAKGTLAEATALDALVAAKSIAIQRSAAYAEAQMAQAAATSSATAAAAASSSAIGRLASGSLALIGGPAGAAVIAAAAIFYFYQKMQQAKEEAFAFADSIDGVVAKMDKISNVQLAAEIDKAINAIKTQKEALSDTRSEIESVELQMTRLKRTLSFLKEDSDAYRMTLSVLSSAQSEHTQLLAREEQESNKLSKTMSSVGILRAKLNGTLQQGINLLRRDGDQAGVAAGMMNKLGDAFNFASRAKDKFNSSSLNVDRSADADKILQNINDENALLSITDKRQRAVAEARQQALKAGAKENSNQLRQIEEAAAAQFDLHQSEADRNNETKSAAKVESQAEQAEKSRKKTLQDLGNEMAVAELKAQGLTREAAQLAAIQDLGAGASQQQIQAAAQQAGQIFDIQQRISDKKSALDQNAVAQAEKARADDLAQLQRQLAAGDVSFEQAQQRRLQIAANYSQQIAEANAKSAVTPQQEAAATVDPVQALANENARKLALIQQFESDSTLTHEQAVALRKAADTQYEKQRIDANWEIWRNQSTANEALAASFDSLAGNASNAFTGMITGSMSAADAARSLGSTVLNSLVNTFVQMGVEWVRAAVTGSSKQIAATAATTSASVAGIATTTAASTASAATTMTAWLPAALVASIGSFGAAAAVGGAALLAGFGLISALSGRRKNGGPVSAGSMYQVGESGLPELYQASNGRQYMIPGDNGSVISNKDLQSGSSSPNVSIQFIDQSTGRKSFDAQSSMDGNTLTVTAFISDLEEDGPMSQSITRNTTASRRANG